MAMQRMQKVSCIICAYNEGPRIGKVLAAAANHPLVGEVIVVDDGSKDETASVVASYEGVRYLSYEENRGKSYAIATGVRASSYPLLFFLDADVDGLAPSDITAMIEPVLSGSVGMTISLRKNSLFIYKLIGLDFISGERVIHRKMIEGHLDAIQALPPFGVEVYINELAIRDRIRIRVVSLKAVTNPSKDEKIGWLEGSVQQLKMVGDILKVISLPKSIEQNYQITKRLSGQKHDFAEKMRRYFKNMEIFPLD